MSEVLKPVEVKKWYFSKVLWGAVATIILGLAPFVEQISAQLPPELGSIVAITFGTIVAIARTFGKPSKLV